MRGLFVVVDDDPKTINPETVSILEGDSGSRTVDVPVELSNPSGTTEPNELVVVSFRNPTNARMGGFYGLGVGAILNDDPPPRVIAGGEVVDEGDTGTVEMRLPVSLSNPTSETVTVEWTTIYEPAWSEVAAEPGVDYQAAAGTVTFAPGRTDQTVPITINTDTTAELDELVVVSFHDPTNAEIGGLGLGFGIIADDDPP